MMRPAALLERECRSLESQKQIAVAALRFPHRKAARTVQELRVLIASQALELPLYVEQSIKQWCRDNVVAFRDGEPESNC